MIKKSTSWAVALYGAIIMGLGYLGYHNSHSKPSLIAGLVSGTILILSALWMFKNKRQAMFVSLFVTFTLTVIFCYRYAMTHATIPTILAILSGAMLLYLLIQMGRWKK